jgi:hypothetical protein
MIRSLALALVLVCACGGETGSTAPPESGTSSPEAGSPGACTPAAVPAEVKLAAPFNTSYRVFTLGSAPGMPLYKYGGLSLKRGDPETLLVGGDANLPKGAIYAVKVKRACKHIVGFEGKAQKLADAPHIDGGLHYAGEVLFFTGYPVNTLAQIVGGASAPSSTTTLAPLGVAESVGASLVVPVGFAGEGSLKLVSWPSGDWYTARLVAAAGGPYTLAELKPVHKLPGGPEGFAYVPKGSPQVSAPSLIVSEWTDGSVALFELDAAGDPVLATRRPFLTGLRGAEGAFFDPATGDFLFSTWRDGEPEQVIIVQGFAPID